ncbi:MAG: hypothetical protein AAGE43_14920, partial [Pseudomonadota bacterium]
MFDAGFLPEGEIFLEAGIEHQAMALALPIPWETQSDVPRPTVRQEAAPEAAESAELKHHDGEGDMISGLITLLETATRHVRIYSQELDHTIFDRSDVIDALSAFVRSGPPARLQVLIHSSSSIVSRGHQLLSLARRLDSKIEIRTVPGELATDQHTTAIIDEQGYLLQPDHREYQAQGNVFDPVVANRLLERFDYLWDRSQTDPELRVLRL